jgi:very-short-patch-repair endonuclease
MLKICEEGVIKNNFGPNATFRQGNWKGRYLNRSINNLPHLKNFRKELRNNATPAEYRLWLFLRKRALDGRKFRRQFSVGNYILDFYCPQEKLAIELDGAGHFEAKQAVYDKKRDLFLMQEGIRVLRFENCKVWNDLQGLLNEVRASFK